MKTQRLAEKGRDKESARKNKNQKRTLKKTEMNMPGKMIIIFLIVFVSKLHGQVDPNICYPKKHADHSNDNYIFHKKNNGYPDTIHITGKIVGIKHAICGFLCVGGSAKIKLTKKIDHYPFDYVYVATRCTDLSGKCQTEVSLTATKLLKTIPDCTLQTVSNIYDKTEIPFYVVTSADLARLQQ